MKKLVLHTSLFLAMCVWLGTGGVKSVEPSAPENVPKNGGGENASVATRVAVMPFVNMTGDPEMSWLGEGLAGTLETKTRTVQSITVIDRERIAAAANELRLSSSDMRREENALRVGKIIGVRHMVLASYRINDDALLVDIRMVDVTMGKTSRSDKIGGYFGRLSELQDRLALKVLTWLDVALTDEMKMEIDRRGDMSSQAFEYYYRAREMYLLGRVKDADKWLKRAVEVDPGNADVLFLRARVNERLRRYDRAVNDYKKAAEIYSGAGNDWEHARAIEAMGTAFAGMERYDLSLEYYVVALEEWKAIGALAGASRTLNSIGLIYQTQGQLDEAVRHYNESMAARQEAGDAYSTGETLNRIGEIHALRGDFGEAIKSFERCVLTMDGIGGHRMKALARCNMGELYVELGRFPEALIAFEDGLKIMKRLGDESGEARNATGIGKVHLRKREYDKALDTLDGALRRYTRIGDKPGIARVYTLLGEYYLEIDNLKGAIMYIDRSLGMRRELDDKADLAESLRLKGILEFRLGRYKASNSFFDESLEIYGKLGARPGIAAVHDEMGNCYKSLRMTDHAIDAWRQSYELYLQMDNHYKAARVKGKLDSLPNRDVKAPGGKR